MPKAQRRWGKVAVLAAAATVGTFATGMPAHADSPSTAVTVANRAIAPGDYYSQCISLQRRAYRIDVQQVGQFWADVVWVGREWACRSGITEV